MKISPASITVQGTHTNVVLVLNKKFVLSRPLHARVFIVRVFLQGLAGHFLPIRYFNFNFLNISGYLRRLPLYNYIYIYK